VRYASSVNLNGTESGIFLHRQQCQKYVLKSTFHSKVQKTAEIISLNSLYIDIIEPFEA
jgi:hypothetical protein